MRNITLKRRFGLARCFTTAKIYIDDPKGNFEINGIKCRRVGSVENAKRTTVTLTNRSARLFVIMDRSTPDVYDVIRLPQGGEDITLSGKTVFGVKNHRPFVLDGGRYSKTAEKGKKAANETRKNRSVKPFIIGTASVLATAILIYAVVLAATRPAKPKEFGEAGISVTLTDDFTEKTSPNFNACWESRDCALFVLRESAGGHNVGKMTLAEYTEFFKVHNKINAPTERYGEYSFLSHGADGYDWMTFIKKTDGGFITLQFRLPDGKTAEMRDTVFGYVNSVMISEAK